MVKRFRDSEQLILADATHPVDRSADPIRTGQVAGMAIAPQCVPAHSTVADQGTEAHDAIIQTC